MTTHLTIACDRCGHLVPAVKCAKYDRNPNHHCDSDGHYCSAECYDIGSGAGEYR